MKTHELRETVREQEETIRLLRKDNTNLRRNLAGVEDALLKVEQEQDAFRVSLDAIMELGEGPITDEDRLSAVKAVMFVLRRS